MTHLFLALNTRGYGETLLGLRVAHELLAAGECCVFLAPDTAAPMLATTPFRHIPCGARRPELVQFAILVAISSVKPDSIVLSDYYTTNAVLRTSGLEPAWLKSFSLPLGAIDTWDLKRTGTAIDVFGNQRREFDDWSDLLDYRVVPVPIADPAKRVSTGAMYYSCLPEATVVTPKIRRHIRRDLGLPDGARAILWCTAEWQHATYPNDHGNRIAAQVPALLLAFARACGPDVHVVHVGPSRVHADPADRYYWLPPLPADEFNKLLASVDLFMATNASSTTIAKALVSQVPVVGVVNSHAVTDLRELGDRLPGEASEWLMSWARQTLPIFPFAMWPLGYHAFLAPLLDGNPYGAAVPMLELLEESQTVARLRDLLFADDVRAAHLARQDEYVAHVRRLPAGGATVLNALSAGVA